MKKLFILLKNNISGRYEVVMYGPFIDGAHEIFGVIIVPYDVTMKVIGKNFKTLKDFNKSLKECDGSLKKLK